MVESMEKIVALCKNRGYIYPGSEIYGGLSNTWDDIDMKNKEINIDHQMIYKTNIMLD